MSATRTTMSGRSTASCDARSMRHRRRWLASAAACWWPAPAQAARIKEVAAVQGVRTNQLVGYGLVVGLDGTGDQTHAGAVHDAKPASRCCSRWA